MDNKKHDREIYGSFYLSGNEFALSVKYIQEVVNPPEQYNNLPLSPSYLIGLFNLRGAIIPVVDLQKLLHLPCNERAIEQKIAILELDGHCIGVLFDRTGEVFRSSVDEVSNFDDASGPQVIQGVFKKDSGKRLIQILDAHALFDLKSLPKAADPIHRRRSLAHQKGPRQQSISFKVGPARCALGISEIQEILKINQVSNTALAYGNCIGAIDLRGITVPIIDFAALLKYRETAAADGLLQGDRRVIVLKLGDEFFGLLVDSVDSIVTFYQEDLRSFPVLNPERSKMFTGCITLEGREDTLLLNSEHIFTNDEIQQITHGHSKIFKNKKTTKEKRNSETASRRTFITFKIEDTYAVQISDVKEIIGFPLALLKPPGLHPSCLGVLNLRGDMIVVADGRTLYTGEKAVASATPKVLIFKIDGLHFGLVVDSVEAICTFSDSEKVKLPEMLYQGNRSGLKEDLTEAVQFKDEAGRETSLLILNPSSIAGRVRSMNAA